MYISRNEAGNRLSIQVLKPYCVVPPVAYFAGSKSGVLFLSLSSDHKSLSLSSNN